MQSVYKCEKCEKIKVVFEDDFISRVRCDDCFKEMVYVDECRDCDDCKAKLLCQ